MRYVGGKARQAKGIATAVVAAGEGRRYVEPFVGGASVLAAVAPHFGRVTASDIVPDLVLFWAAVRDGWVPPAEVSADEYEHLRTAAASPLRAWAGFAASYNGKWWGGYGPKAAGRDYLAESLRSTLKKAKALDGVDFVCSYYGDADVTAECVVYADPPYADTLGYAAAGAFDTATFWQTMAAWHGLGAAVFVSEYTAPPGWVAVDSFKRVENNEPRRAVKRRPARCPLDA